MGQITVSDYLSQECILEEEPFPRKKYRIFDPASTFRPGNLVVAVKEFNSADPKCLSVSAGDVCRVLHVVKPVSRKAVVDNLEKSVLGSELRVVGEMNINPAPFIDVQDL